MHGTSEMHITGYNKKSPLIILIMSVTDNIQCGKLNKTFHTWDCVVQEIKEDSRQNVQ